MKKSAEKKSSSKKNGKRVVNKDGSRLSLAPLTVEEAVTAMFAVRAPAKGSKKGKPRGTS